MNLNSAVQDAKAMQDFELELLKMGADHSQMVKAASIISDYGSKDCVNFASSTAEFRLNLESAVQDAKVMQNFEVELLKMGADHSQMVKAASIISDYGSKDCVNFASSTAEFRLNVPEPENGEHGSIFG